MNFVGSALPLSDGDVRTIAGYLGCEVAAVRAVLQIEAGVFISLVVRTVQQQLHLSGKMQGGITVSLMVPEFFVSVFAMGTASL